MSNNYLVISDLQIPFEHDKALDFCLRVQKEFKISKFNIINIGDEIDQYYASRFPKDPDAVLSARGELKIGRERLKEWYRAFPVCRVCISNHGLRWLARAHECYIPSEILRPYKELIEAPQGWSWHEEIKIKDDHPWRAIHGVGYSGINGHRNAAIDGRMSTVIGHLHAFSGTCYINNGKSNIWAMNAGCLINTEEFAFKYAKHSRNKATLSVGVVLDSGKTPLVVPM